MSKKLVIVLVVLLVAAGGLAAWVWLGEEEEPQNVLVASGTVEATDAAVSFQVPGKIARIDPEEGDELAAGDPIAALATGELEARRREAQARVEATRARLEELRRGFRHEEIAQARVALRAARQRLADAERDLERTRTLHAGGAVPREALDKAELAHDLATADVEQATERLALLETGPRPEQIDAARAELESARAAVEALDARLADTEIAAPFAGVVQVRHREPGEVVGAGVPVVTLSDLSRRWVRIYVREDRIGAVHLGLPTTIVSDTYPDRRYAGRVFFIASEAEFTPENVQTQEERVRLVYAVKVRVLEDPERELKPGMPVDVKIDLDDSTREPAG